MRSARAGESVSPGPPTSPPDPKGRAEGAPNVPDRGGVLEGGARPPLQLTIGSAFLATAARVPSRVAIRFEGQETTYAGLARESGRLGAALRARCDPGDRVGVMLPNRPEFLVAVLGIARAGLVSVPVPAGSTPREVDRVVEDSGLRVLLTQAELRELLAGASGSVGDQATERDAFFVGYTSGTTGRPRGAVVSHRARTLLALVYGLEYGCYAPAETHLITTPMYHGAGLSRALTPLLSGSSIELHERFDPERVVRAIAAGGVTATYMVPTMFASIFELPPALLDLGAGRLRTVLSNAAALPEHLKLRILERWPEVRLFEIYGSTEAGTVASLRPEDQRRKQRCVGLPLPLTEVRIVGEDGSDVAPGEVGRLYSRSPFQFEGYHADPAATAAVTLDGFLTAGDLARRDEEGYLYIVGRTSDVIVTGGVNVYPREVEEYLAELPGVREAVVVGRPDPHWGEAVHAYLVARPGVARPSPEELRAHCRRGLAPAKIPKSFTFRETLPRTGSGKVVRRALAEAGEG
jgi:long-chain acyl-CoA synthetase